MTTKYMKFEVSIHGIDAPDLEAASECMMRVLKCTVLATLHGRQSDLFRARDEFDSDIEVELVESAGENGSAKPVPHEPSA